MSFVDEGTYNIPETDFYRKTFALASAYNPYEIDEYFQKFYAINSGE